MTVVVISGCINQKQYVCPNGKVVSNPTLCPKTTTTTTVGVCQSDTDCVPATCCHSDECVYIAYKPDCKDIVCTGECQPGTMDCEQGSCICENNVCYFRLTKTINVLDISCTQGNITIILSNDGTTDIKDSELIVMVDGNVKSDKFSFNPDPIPPYSTAVATSSETYGTSAVHTVTVTSPSNSVRAQSWC